MVMKLLIRHKWIERKSETLSIQSSAGLELQWDTAQYTVYTASACCLKKKKMYSWLNSSEIVKINWRQINLKAAIKKKSYLCIT